MKTWIWTVEPTSERADRAILTALESGKGLWEGTAIHVSRSQLQRLIEQEQVTCDGTPIRQNAKLKPGSSVRVTFPPPSSTDVRPEDRPINVLYEDEHILVVNKPPGLTVHPSETQMEGTLVNALLHHIKDLSGIGGELRPGIVHRIDKNTSGALVISKSDDAHRALADTFSKHEIERVYWALCYGAPPGPAFGDFTRIETHLGRNPKDRKKMAIVERGGRRAVTLYRKLEEYSSPNTRGRPFASWLEVTLETGRTHQVRVHLTSLSHSLLGDPVYGTPGEKQAKWIALPDDIQEAVKELPGQALHARVLGFSHPITGEKLRFEAEPPAGFVKLLHRLQKYR